MSTDDRATGVASLHEQLRAHLDELEAALEADVTAGRARLDERVDDLRERVEDLRDVDAEAEPGRVERLAEAFERLSTAVADEVDEGRARVWAAVDDLDARVRELERRFRER